MADGATTASLLVSNDDRNWYDANRWFDAVNGEKDASAGNNEITPAHSMTEVR